DSWYNCRYAQVQLKARMNVRQYVDFGWKDFPLLIDRKEDNAEEVTTYDRTGFFHYTAVLKAGDPVVVTSKGIVDASARGGGGDVPGLNPAIRAVTIRALREGYQVVGIRHGWLGAISILRGEHADNSEHFQILTEEIVNRAARTGGTFLHTSRTNPSAVKKEEVPEALRATFDQDRNDLTSEVIKNLDWLGIDYLIPVGGDDTLSFATRLSKEGVKV